MASTTDFTMNARLTILSPEMQELSDRAKADGARFPKKRFIFPQIAKYTKERIFVALIGPRGAGKSVLLRQLHHASADSFYISLDTQKPTSLFNIAKELEGRKTPLLLLDEIHAYPNYGLELKKIYDFLPDMHIVFTSSSAISLHDASYDLSRRVRRVPIYPFSFREFLYFEREQEVPALTWDDLLDVEKCRAYYGKVIHAESLFEAYLCGRNYPFMMGQSYHKSLFDEMRDTVIEKDLVMPSKLTLSESFEARKMMTFIGRSPVEDISYTSIAKNIGITPHKVQKYAALLEKAYLLNIIMPKGTNLSKEPKILLTPPYRLLYKNYEDCIGALREDFFVDAARRLGVDLDYLKGIRGEKTPDYLLNGIVCEIGGVSKSRRQFKGYSAKRKLIFTQPGTLDPMRRPLFFAGMLQERDG
jgi:hypothetical protein